jgi:uncharacterized membrane protein
MIDFEEELDKRKPFEAIIEPLDNPDQSSTFNYAAAVGPWDAFSDNKFYTNVAIIAIKILEFVMSLPLNI